MIHITYQRSRCIGCNYCAEVDPDHWVMSKKDGKANFIGAKLIRGLHHHFIHTSFEDRMENVSKNCPVKIIKVLYTHL